MLYPTSALGVPFHPDENTRRTTCSAFNTFIADYFGDFSDRMTPAAVIPMNTPEEAIAELEYVVKQLGLEGRHDGERGAAAKFLRSRRWLARPRSAGST